MTITMQVTAAMRSFHAPALQGVDVIEVDVDHVDLQIGPKRREEILNAAWQAVLESGGCGHSEFQVLGHAFLAHAH